MLISPKVKIEGIPLAASKSHQKHAMLHNNYCDENIGNISDAKKNERPTSTYPMASTPHITKNLYVGESVKVLESIIL